MSGLSARNLKFIETALQNSYFSIYLRNEEGLLIRMGRVIADGQAVSLYQQYGFELTAPDSVGMTYV